MINRKNLIELTIHLLRNEKKGKIKIKGKEFEFDMRDYIQTENQWGRKVGISFMDDRFDCGTSCCALGDWMLLKDVSVNQAELDMGVKDLDPNWQYLFGMRNPNDVVQFAKRVYTLLTKDQPWVDFPASKTGALKVFQQLKKNERKA